MARHLVCLTIDTDPDGQNGKVKNRQMLEWVSLKEIRPLLDELESLRPAWGSIPVTWFVRADGQLRDILGSPLYLLEEFEPLWREVYSAGHELGWHPHLYRQAGPHDTPTLISDPEEAVCEIERLWMTVSQSSLRPVSFRNGEGWHYPATFAVVERLGFQWDSTAIPGRMGGDSHPMNWVGSPNHSYFPDERDLRRPGQPRPLLEIPMNTWLVQASYDREPRLRYMNPAIHERLFAKAVEMWRESLHDGPSIWTLIMHPDEVLGSARPDLLYAHATAAVRHNLATLAYAIQEAGHEVQFATLSQAGHEWRRREEVV